MAQDAATQARLNLLFTKLERLIECEENDEEYVEDDVAVDINAEIVVVSDKILALLPMDPDALKCRAVALINSGRYGHVQPGAGSDPAEAESIAVERAYALYKEGKLEAAERELEAVEEDVTTLQMRAQIKYKMGDYDAAAATYARVCKLSLDDEDFDDDDRAELLTNRAAALVNSGEPTRALQAIDDQFPTDSMYELTFNRACALIDCGEYARARDEISRAERLAQQSDSSASVTTLQTIRTLRALVDQTMGRGESAAKAYEEVVAALPRSKNAAVVALNNIISLRGDDRELFGSAKRLRGLETMKSLTARQKRLLLLNQLSLMVLTGKVDTCQRLLEQLRSDKHLGADVAIDAALVEASVLFRQKDLDGCKERLRNHVAAGESSDKLHVALAHCAILSGDIAGAIKTLSGVSRIRGTPGAAATLVALHERLGQSAEAQKVLEDAMQGESVSPSVHATLMSAAAEIHLRAGEHSKAADLYRRLAADELGLGLDVKARAAARANLVKVLLRVDRKQAMDEARQLPQPPPLEHISVEDLELANAPKAAAERRRAASAASVAASAAETKSAADAKGGESKDVIKASMRDARQRRRLKRRAKRREAYVARLKAEAAASAISMPVTDPDPERWVPRRLRRQNRRNRGRRARDKQMGGGHQGGAISKEDLERFDAAARAAKEREAEAQGETKGKGRANRKKKGKKKKKGRR